MFTSGEDTGATTSPTLAQATTSLITEFTQTRLDMDAMEVAHKETETMPIGVVEHFNKGSLHHPITPTIVQVKNSPKYSGLFIRASPDQGRHFIESVHKVWGQFYPKKLFEPNWVSDLLDRQYEKEGKLRQLFVCFAVLSMLLSALGIFGLIGQETAQRAYEVGVRKVLGASVRSIILLFSKDMFKLLLLGILIGSPIAWYGGIQWLENYAHRIPMEWWIIALSSGMALSIALCTVIFQTVKAAIVNPVKSLRTE